jgi:hypothetical protein
MATNNKRLSVTELDFDDIKDNLKIFLKAQSEFKDYDFEGSGMSVLLDTLAYNTHYLGFNANMAANEMFLDSASLRSSIVSHAKMLGYEVSSARAPKATINISLNTQKTTATMPAGTAFTSTTDGTSYQFVTISDITGTSTGNAVPFDSTEIYEGTYITTKYIVDSSDIDQRFIITNNRSDTTTLTVKVQNSVSDTTSTTYTKATDISQLSRSSTVYFLQEIDSGKFEVYFGDGIVSQSLSDGNIVVLQYVVTNKTLANGASSFTSPSAIDTVTNITITTVANASGGAESESLQSIKLNAPLDFAAQGRAVTTEDYRLYARKLFANTQTVSVWGGEDGSYNTSSGVSATAEYGKVFISIKSTTGENLTITQKDQLIKDLEPYKVASITPVIVDPETTSLILGVTYSYDSNVTTKTATDISSLVNSTLQTYNTTNLNTFNAPFRHSQLSGDIDDTDNSILMNTTTVTMGRLFTPTTTGSTSYTINFNNAFYHPVDGYQNTIIASTGFYIEGGTTEYFFDDDGSGNLRIYSIAVGVRTYYSVTAGTVDYTNGLVTINGILISSSSNVDGSTSTKIRITALSDSNDVIPVRNQLLEIDFANSTITAKVDAAATTGIGYTTTTTGTTTSTTVNTTSSTTPSSSY